MRTSKRTFRHAGCPAWRTIRIVDYTRMYRPELLQAAVDRGLGPSKGDNFDVIGRLVADDLRRANSRGGVR